MAYIVKKKLTSKYREYTIFIYNENKKGAEILKLKFSFFKGIIISQCSVNFNFKGCKHIKINIMEQLK